MRGRGGPRLGEYVETGSPLHRVPPLAKLFVVAGFLAAAALTGPRVLLVLLAMAGGLAALARMPLPLCRSLLRMVLWFALLTVAAQLLLGGAAGPGPPGSGEELLSRLAAAARAGLRASLALIALSTLVMTTPPVEAAEAVIGWGRGRRGGRRHAGLGLAVVMAFRFYPLLAGELVRLRRAREARGARFGGEGWRRALREWGELFPAFLATALRRAEEVALALEARGFAG